jgi:beta-mannosidase
VRTIDLAGAWQLTRVSTGERFAAAVPGDTHSALLAAGAIPDPGAGMNELAVQWVGREDWEYSRAVRIDAALLREEDVFLTCECLDTLAEIRVNGRLAGRADNAFVRWRFDVKRLLRPGSNTIGILFRSAEKAARAAAGRLPYPVPHVIYPVQSPHRNLVRKVQCHAGWDWGPCLMASGIEGAISIGATSAVRIDYLFAEQEHSGSRCRVRVFAECTAARAGDYPFAVTLGDAAVRATVRLLQGANRPWVDLVVKDPRLWWPNGYGEQPLYDLEVTLGDDTSRTRLGLRTIELVNRHDAKGLSMTFRVNGVPVFCKGANWIPCDALPQRQDRQRIQGLLASARSAHMNMLRVWGGGRYESDDFYDLCDEMGLLVWQDMMFSCALYPADPAFLAGVEREARHQALRLRGRTCLALWCGNNEDLGALTWFPESRDNRDRYLVDYDRLNEGVIGRVLDDCAPGTAFWPSSPSGGRGDYSDNWHDDARGDMHFWSVWHEGKPFSAFREAAPRFCSEFGFQSFPSLETIRTFADEGSLNATSPVMEHHQRHPRGNSLITEMMTRYFRVPEGFENFVYLSQVLQAVAIETAVQWWRRLRPACMGTLYWQLNDTWPVCSWSSLEYGGKWKLLHYAARRFYAPLLVAGFLVGEEVQAWVVNDSREKAAGRLTARLTDFDGRVLRRESRAVSIPAGSSRRLLRRPVAQLLAAGRTAASPHSCFLHLALETRAGAAANEVFFAEHKRCGLARASVRAEVRAAAAKGAPPGSPRLRVTLTTDRPAFFVALDAAGIPGEFDDNCLTLLPGEPRTIGFSPRGRVTAAELRKSLSVRHLRETYR